MKFLNPILLLFVGALLGSVGAVRVHDWRRAQAIQALPSLADRNHSPVTDELPVIILSRRDGQLRSEVRDGMGPQRKDIAEQSALQRRFSDTPLIFRIHFEPGVTMQDLEATIAELSEQGVERYFLGSSIYGKHVGY